MEENQQQNNPTGENIPPAAEKGKSMAEKLKESIEERQVQQAGGGEEVQMPQQKKESGGINKYIIIAIVIVLFLGTGIGYRAFFVPEAAKPVVTGIERALTIVVNQNTWSFKPEFIEADQGDKMILTIINEDDYDHGFAIDAFGISQRMPARATIVIDFVVTKAGDFPYYCSVSCGSGIVLGEARGHFDQIGRIHVRSLISETVDFVAEPTVDFRAVAKKAAMRKEAGRKLTELGYGATEADIVIDEENKEWLESGRTLLSLEGTEYQALYYVSEELELAGRIWVFIDTITGEVVDTVVDE